MKKLCLCGIIKQLLKQNLFYSYLLNERKIKMSIWGIVLGVLLAIVSVAIIVVIQFHCVLLLPVMMPPAGRFIYCAATLAIRISLVS